MNTPHQPWSQDIVVLLPAFEPAHVQVQLTNELLVQHSLFIGSSGSGKTTLMNRLVHDLIHYQSRDRERKCAVIILDAKADDSTAKIRDWAAQAGRSEDLVLLDGGGDAFLPLLQTEGHDLESLTRRLLAGTADMGRENGYWTETRRQLLTAGLQAVRLLEPEASFGRVMEFLEELLLGKDSDTLAQETAERLETQAQTPQTPSPERRLYERTAAELRLWAGLDQRTKLIHQTCLANALNPLLTPEALSYFQGQGKPFVIEELLAQGGIGLVSVDAVSQPRLAQLILRLIKDLALGAMQRRSAAHGSKERLAVLVMDELPLFVSPEDLTALQTIRCRRGAVVAATQGFSALDVQVGSLVRSALLNNFGNLFFLRSREGTVDQLAEQLFGREIVTPEPGPALAGLGYGEEWRPSISRPVCPPGTLTKLQTNQAYVCLAEGRQPKNPLWLAPLHFDGPEVPRIKPPLTAPVLPARAIWTLVARYTERLMQQAGYRPLLTPAAWGVLLGRLQPSKADEHYLQSASQFFRERCLYEPAGLDRLPPCWLAALPGLLLKLAANERGKVNLPIVEVACQDGLLLLHFARDRPEQFAAVPRWNYGMSSADRLRVQLNAAVYPGRYRPVKLQHRPALWRYHEGPGVWEELTVDVSPLARQLGVSTTMHLSADLWQQVLAPLFSQPREAEAAVLDILLGALLARDGKISQNPIPSPKGRAMLFTLVLQHGERRQRLVLRSLWSQNNRHCVVGLGVDPLPS